MRRDGRGGDARASPAPALAPYLERHASAAAPRALPPYLRPSRRRARARQGASPPTRRRPPPAPRTPRAPPLLRPNVCAAARARRPRRPLRLWTRLPPSRDGAASDLGEIGAVAAALNELNAFDGASVDELDYERRVSGYAALPPLVNRAPPPLLLPLLANAIHDVGGTTSRCATRPPTRSRCSPAAPPPSRRPPTARRRRARGLLERVLMPALRRHLRLPPGATLFVERRSPRSTLLLSRPRPTSPRCSPAEPEADFFYNITTCRCRAASARSHGSAHASTAAPSRSRRSRTTCSPCSAPSSSARIRTRRTSLRRRW